MSNNEKRSQATLLASRPLTSRFHIAVFDVDGKLQIDVIKTTNGQVVPLDEPLVLLRARDRLAIPTLQAYGRIIATTTYPDLTAQEEHLTSNKVTIEKFRAFAEQHPDRMKLPNITRGK